VSEKPEVKTFMMRCPHCKKSTQCKELNIPMPKGRKGGGVPPVHHYQCMECKMGWSIPTGGQFSLQ